MRGDAILSFFMSSMRYQNKDQVETLHSTSSSETSETSPFTNAEAVDIFDYNIEAKKAISMKEMPNTPFPTDLVDWPMYIN